MSNPTFTQFVETLTVEQAAEWAAQSEKFMHVVDTFDQVLRTDGTVVESRVAAVEARFNLLLEEPVDIVSICAIMYTS